MVIHPLRKAFAMKGTCLCGSIEVTAPNHKQVSVCHCSLCRRWSGGPMFAVHFGSPVKFSGATPVAYRSSEWAERGFCATCGTQIKNALAEGAKAFFIPVYKTCLALLSGRLFIAIGRRALLSITVIWKVSAYQLQQALS